MDDDFSRSHDSFESKIYTSQVQGSVKLADDSNVFNSSRKNLLPTSNRVKPQASRRNSHRNPKSISSKFSSKIIKRAPDKMIDFIDGLVVLAYRHDLYYFDTETLVNNLENEAEKQVQIFELNHIAI